MKYIYIISFLLIIVGRKHFRTRFRKGRLGSRQKW